jgi:DNA adenine methylase
VGWRQALAAAERTRDLDAARASPAGRAVLRRTGDRAGPRPGTTHCSTTPIRIWSRFYQWLQRGLTIDLPLENNESLFYRHRDRFNALLRAGASDTKEAASLFYYLNRTGYNGLCRFNRDGEFNVPFGRHASINYERDLTKYVGVLAPWTFTNVDIEAVPLDPSDFVYADPPYDVQFTHYAKHGFSWEDQERTAVALSRHSGPVVLVNQATPRITRLYKGLGFRLRHLDAPRRISCTGDRRPAREVLATRNVTLRGGVN